MKNFVQYIVPVLFWMALIFRLSAVPADALPHMPTEFWLFWAHKATHFFEYTVLGFLSARAVSRYTGISKGAAVVLIFMFAISDEWHQSFTPGRSPSIIDASLDLVYGCLGMFLFTRIQRTFKKQ